MADLHYATISDIRSEAGFSNAANLSDWVVGDQRRAAESEINAALGNAYVTPFVVPIPEIIRTLTIKLAAAMLAYNAFRSQTTQDDLESVRKTIQSYAGGSILIPGVDGIDLSTAEGVSFDFGDEPRMFTVGQRF